MKLRISIKYTPNVAKGRVEWHVEIMPSPLPDGTLRSREEAKDEIELLSGVFREYESDEIYEVDFNGYFLTLGASERTLTEARIQACAARDDFIARAQRLAGLKREVEEEKGMEEDIEV